MAFDFDIRLLNVEFKERNNQLKPLVFVHGNSQNATCGKGVIEFFADLGHTTLTYDLPGHGNSPLESENYQFSDLVSLNYRILKHFEISSPILCGHSLGGMIHSATIANFDIADAALILCNSLDANPSFHGPRYLSSSKANQLESALNSYMDEGFKLFKRQKCYDYFSNKQVEDEIVNIINRRYSNPAASKINLQTLGELDCRKALIKLKVPILALHGDNEQVIDPELVKALAGENQQVILEWFVGGGHLAFYQQSEKTNEYLKKHYRHICAIPLN